MTIEINPRTEEIAGTGVTLDLTSSNAGLAAGSGQLVQQAYDESTAYQSAATAMPFDDTIPQITEGDEVLSVTITPTDASNVLYIEVSLPISSSAANNVVMALFDGSADAIASSVEAPSAAGFMVSAHLQHRQTAGTTSPITFTVRVGQGSGTAYINGTNLGRRAGGSSKATMKVMEIDPVALSPATPGLLLQHVYAEERAHSSITTEIPHDDTIPQQTEGTEIMTASITPISASSILEITCGAHLGVSGSNFNVLALFQDSTPDALEALCFALTGANFTDGFVLHHRVVAGSTSPTTFKIRAGVQTGSGATVYANGVAAGRRLGGAAKCYIQVKELTP